MGRNEFPVKFINEKSSWITEELLWATNFELLTWVFSKQLLLPPHPFHSTWGFPAAVFSQRLAVSAFFPPFHCALASLINQTSNKLYLVSEVPREVGIRGFELDDHFLY